MKKKKQRKKVDLKKWVKQNKKAVPIFVIVYIVFFSQVWVPLLLGWVLGNKKLVSIGLAIEAFWAPPITPGIPICIAITTAITKTINRRKSLKFKVKRYMKMNKASEKKIRKLLLIYKYELLECDDVKMFDEIAHPKLIGDYDFTKHTVEENERYLLNWQRRKHILLRDYVTIEEKELGFKNEKLPIIIQKKETTAN